METVRSQWELEISNKEIDLCQEGYQEILDENVYLEEGQFRKSAISDFETSELWFVIEWVPFQF